MLGITKSLNPNIIKCIIKGKPISMKVAKIAIAIRLGVYLGPSAFVLRMIDAKNNKRNIETKIKINIIIPSGGEDCLPSNLAIKDIPTTLRL